MKPKIKSAPVLRFPEFTDALQARSLEDLSKDGFSNGVFNDPEKVGRGYRLVNVKDMYVGSSIDVETLSLINIDKKLFERNRVTFGDVFFTRSSLVREGIAHSNVYLNREQDITFDGHLIKMSPNQNLVSPEFLGFALRTSTIRRQLIAGGKTTTMTTIGQEDIAGVRVVLPSIVEQEKIAAFLSAVDEKIAQLVRKKELLLKYKKGVIQQIFDRRIRFEDDNGQDFSEWEEKRLSQISTVVTRTLPKAEGIPIMTISGRRGFLNQEDRFSKVIAGESLENYIALQKGELAYNRGNSKSAIYGSINLMTNEIALVPFVYHCFRVKKKVDPQFIEYFSASDYVNRQLRRIITSTARMNGLLNISKSDFFATKFKIPCYQEQRKIVSLLAVFSEKVEAVSKQLEKTRTFKKGLLQHMFV
jgi:type I restriction enzyme S subunit